jgi:hypothetical protein
MSTPSPVFPLAWRRPAGFRRTSQQLLKARAGQAGSQEARDPWRPGERWTLRKGARVRHLPRVVPSPESRPGRRDFMTTARQMPCIQTIATWQSSDDGASAGELSANLCKDRGCDPAIGPETGQPVLGSCVCRIQLLPGLEGRVLGSDWNPPGPSQYWTQPTEILCPGRPLAESAALKSGEAIHARNRPLSSRNSGHESLGPACTHRKRLYRICFNINLVVSDDHWADTQYEGCFPTCFLRPCIELAYLICGPMRIKRRPHRTPTVAIRKSSGPHKTAPCKHPRSKSPT